MNFLTNTIIFCTLALVIFAQDKYTTKYDNIDLKAILSNDRLLRNYVDCLLDMGKCTPDGAELKKIIPEALETECSKCSEAQKEGLKMAFHHLSNKQKPWLNELIKKYDPENKYQKRYTELLKKEGITL